MERPDIIKKLEMLEEEKVALEELLGIYSDLSDSDVTRDGDEYQVTVDCTQRGWESLRVHAVGVAVKEVADAISSDIRHEDDYSYRKTVSVKFRRPLKYKGLADAEERISKLEYDLEHVTRTLSYVSSMLEPIG